MIDYRVNKKRQKQPVKIQDSGHRFLEERVYIRILMRLLSLEEKPKKGCYFPIMGQKILYMPCKRLNLRQIASKVGL